MKALLLDATQVLRFGDAPDGPNIQGEADWVTVAIKAAGICGADLLAYTGLDHRRRPQSDDAPLILGHEAAGVVQGGPMADSRVAINPVITCGECAYCVAGQTNICAHREVLSIGSRAGTLATHVVVPPANLIPVPDEMSMGQAALIEPLARGWHVARLARRAFPRGRNALVIGGGGIGLAAALGLKAQGVPDTRICEKNFQRAAYLRGPCDQVVAAPDGLPTEATFDIVIDAVGSMESRALASAQVKPGGILGHIGLSEVTGGMDMQRLTLQEVTIICAYGYSAMDFEQCAQAAFDGRLGPLDWFETRDLAQGAQAFADLVSGAVAVPRLILEP